VCFSDLDFNWANAGAPEREKRLRYWLRTERQYAAM
jgi:hypothetical protein